MMTQNEQIKEIQEQHLRNCVLFTDCISEINNTQIDNEYSDNYSKISGCLCNVIEMSHLIK